MTQIDFFTEIPYGEHIMAGLFGDVPSDTEIMRNVTLLPNKHKHSGPNNNHLL